MANPAFLQGATHSLYGAGPAAVAFPSNTVAGDLLLVFAYSGAFNDTLSISDGVNTWNSIQYSGGIAGNTGTTQLWYAIAVGGASTPSVSSPSGAGSRNITIGEWSANGNTFTLDKSALTSASDTTYTSLTSSSVSTTQANELLIGAFMSSGNVTTWTAGSNYNIQKQGNSGPSTVFEDQLVSSTNSYSASVTLTSTLGGVAKGIVTFAFAPSGGGVSTTLAAAPVPATVVNSSGYSLPITSPTLGTKLGQPNPVVSATPTEMSCSDRLDKGRVCQRRTPGRALRLYRSSLGRAVRLHIKWKLDHGECNSDRNQTWPTNPCRSHGLQRIPVHPLGLHTRQHGRQSHSYHSL